MPLRQKIFAIIISLSLLLFIVELVRRKKLREEYSWLWLLTGTIILILALWYDLLQWITHLIGARLPTSTLFFLGLVFLILIAIQFSIKVSELNNQVKNLTQENGLLKNRIEEIEEEKTSTDRNEKRRDYNGEKGEKREI
ncbi:MAG: hypothetical protein AMJ42_01005 [Deltaproteobacteria bacterium DG_8]|nr:MAG: hypothetical protein AMJ42_01005 [Deltaproteobacteria bacterium DG_8]